MPSLYTPIVNKQELLERHQELLDRFEAKAKKLKTQHWDWSIQRCRAEAVILLPKTYGAYLDTKAEMMARGVRLPTARSW